MWDDIFKRWVDLLFWWLPKKEQSSTERTEERSRPSTEPGIAGRSEATRQSEAARPREAAPRPEPPRPSEPPRPAEPPRRSEAPPRPEPAAAPKREAPRAAPDDLTEIKGIGPAVQEKLRSLGIATFKDLARANPDDLVEQLKGSQPISKARVQGWTQSARERVGGG